MYAFFCSPVKLLTNCHQNKLTLVIKCCSHKIIDQKRTKVGISLSKLFFKLKFERKAVFALQNLPVINF